MALVGLMGRKRSGKDSFASALIEDHGFHRIAFADPLKEALLRFDPLMPTMTGAERLSSIVASHGWEVAKEYPAVRKALQDYGVIIREVVDPQAWIRVAERNILSAPSAHVVVTDVRFPNEVAAIRRAGGTLVYIERPGLPDDGDSHVSETSTSAADADVVVLNTGTLEDLRLDAGLFVTRRLLLPGAFAVGAEV
jgi:hypothetical protein